MERRMPENNDFCPLCGRKRVDFFECPYCGINFKQYEKEGRIRQQQNLLNLNNNKVTRIIE